jgi:protein SCO1/2
MRALLKSWHRWLALVSLALAAGLSACQQQKPWALRDISGIVAPLEFHLTNQDGQTVDGSSYRGKTVLLYFGYTHCPDVCPTTLGTLALALNRLGPDAGKVRVLFVTVDPARDSVTVLKQYVTAFGPQFVGLRGSDAELQELSRRYRIAYALEKPDRQGNYTVAHSNAVFVFDDKGNARLLGGSDDKADAIAQDLKRLIAAG